MSYSFNNLTLSGALDSATSAPLNIGTANATSINFGKTGVSTNFIGPINSTQPVSFDNIDTTSTLTIGKITATKVEIGRVGQETEVKGSLTIPNPTTNLHAVNKVYADTLTTTGALVAGSITNTFGPIVLKQTGTGSEGEIYYNNITKKINYHNGTTFNEVSGDAGSVGNFTDCILYQGGNTPISINVYAQKLNSIVTLFIPTFNITVSADTTEILSSQLSYTNLQPSSNIVSSIFINNIMCSVKIENNILKIKPSANFTVGAQIVDGFSLTYRSNSITLTDGQWGLPAPTVVISVSPTTTLKKTETATVTFTFSADPLLTFDLTDVSGTGAGLLSALAGTGLTRTATFTPTDSNNLTTYAIDVLAGKFIVNGIPNTNSATLNISADTRLPSINSLFPTDNSTGILVSDDLKITFDEPVVKGTGDIRLYKTTGDVLYRTISVTDASVIINSAIVTITQPDMDIDVDYYVLIDNETFRDEQGNSFSGITSPTEWKFTVGTTITILRYNALNLPVGSITSLNDQNGIHNLTSYVPRIETSFVKVVEEPLLSSNKVLEFNEACLSGFNSPHYPIGNSFVSILLFKHTFQQFSNIFQTTEPSFYTTYNDGRTETFGTDFNPYIGTSNNGNTNFIRESFSSGYSTFNSQYGFFILKSNGFTSIPSFTRTIGNGNDTGYTAMPVRNLSDRTENSFLYLGGGDVQHLDVISPSSPIKRYFIGNIAEFQFIPEVVSDDFINLQITEIKQRFGITW